MKMLVKLSIVATLFFVALFTSNETKAQANPVSQKQSFRQTLISSTMDLINQKIKLQMIRIWPVSDLFIIR